MGTATIANAGFPSFQTSLFQNEKNTKTLDVGGIRSSYQLTIRQFARMLGVPVSTYTQWEYEGIEPSGAALSLLKIAAARPEVVHEVLGSQVEIEVKKHKKTKVK